MAVLGVVVAAAANKSNCRHGVCGKAMSLVAVLVRLVVIVALGISAA
jgi:hypothetical protein